MCELLQRKQSQVRISKQAYSQPSCITIATVSRAHLIYCLLPRPQIEYWAIGGDFGDVPNDAQFCANGLVFPDRT
jgi:hypothetical protein